MKPIDFERYLVEEASPEVVEAIERRMSTDPSFADEVRRRRQERRSFPLDPRRRRFAELVQEADQERWWRRRLGPRRSGSAPGIGLGVMALLSVALFLSRPQEELPIDRGVRVKGGVSVKLAIAGHDGRGVEPYERGQPLRPGDRVRFSIDDAVGGFVTVLLEEKGGEVELVYRPGELGQLSPGRHELPGSLELDARLGRERLYVLITPGLPNEEDWRSEIQSAQAERGFDHGWLPAAPTRYQTIEYHKVP